jgi:hypothetical protein
LIFHAVAFFVAGLFVVFTVLPKEEPEFKAPPPVERPKMKLKKPKVKIKKSSQPKPSSRIVAKVKTAKMPEIQIPDLVGTGEGLLGGLGTGGDFMDIPEIEEVTLFGGGQTAGTDLEVTFYAFAKKRDGSPNPNMQHREYFKIIREFVAKGWNTRDLARYYHSPKKLYATTIAIPIVSSILGPLAFGEDMRPAYAWAAHYRGKIVHKEGITFRFWGASDDVLTVAIDKKVVLSANFPWNGVDAYLIAPEWEASAPGSRNAHNDSGRGTYYCGNTALVGGDWITLAPGEEHDFDAIAGEGPGGEFFAMLMVEVQGEDYPLNDWGAPIFPLFATEPLSWELQDNILKEMYDGEANVTNVTTFFNDL